MTPAAAALVTCFTASAHALALTLQTHLVHTEVDTVHQAACHTCAATGTEAAQQLRQRADRHAPWHPMAPEHWHAQHWLQVPQPDLELTCAGSHSGGSEGSGWQQQAYQQPSLYQQHAAPAPAVAAVPAAAAAQHQQLAVWGQCTWGPCIWGPCLWRQRLGAGGHAGSAHFRVTACSALGIVTDQDAAAQLAKAGHRPHGFWMLRRLHLLLRSGVHSSSSPHGHDHHCQPSDPPTFHRMSSPCLGSEPHARRLGSEPHASGQAPGKHKVSQVLPEAALHLWSAGEDLFGAGSICASGRSVLTEGWPLWSV